MKKGPLMRARVSFFTLLILTGLPCIAAAQQANSDYTIKLGDTCPSIAQKAYGDRRAIELIHGANPQLGAAPHNLKPGMVVHLPPAAALPQGPDARVTFVRNKVTVQAQATKNAQVNDPLYRTNRVSTSNASSANVTFRDETQIRVGEESLVIILGDTQGASKKQAASATLVTGTLQARLGELSGKKPLTLETQGGGTVSMTTGSAIIAVDEHKATRLAVHGGEATLATPKAVVPVPSGFGSKAEQGKAPSPPRPLPDSPVWSTPPAEAYLAANDGLASFKAVFAPGTAAGKPAATLFRVRLARDRAFDDLVVDSAVPSNVRAVDARRLPPGAYFLKVSGIDDDAFEGAPGPIAKVVVVSLSTSRATDGTMAIAVSPGAGVACAVAGKPLTALDPTETHTVTCALEPSDAFVRGKELAASPASFVVQPLVKSLRVAARLVEADPLTGRGHIEVSLADDAGKVFAADSRVVLTATNGVEVTEAKVVGDKLAATVRFPATARPFFIRATHADATGESDMIRIPPPPPDAPRPKGVPAARAPRGFEIAVSGGLGHLFSNHGGRQLTVSTAYRAPLGSSLAVAIGPAVSLARFDASLVDADAISGAPPGAVSRHMNVLLALPIALRFVPSKTFSPYITAGPEVVFQRARFTAPSSVEATGFMIGARFSAGAQVDAGPGWAFVEAVARGSAVVSSDRAAEALSGVGIDFGYRFAP